jgi:hypothetical protein
MDNNNRHFYCNICRKTISKGAFMYSKDKFGKALCLEHQKEHDKYQETTIKLDSHTKKMQDLVKSIHKDELHTTEVELTDIKDWINSDVDTWKKALNRNKNEEYTVTSKTNDKTEGEKR